MPAPLCPHGKPAAVPCRLCELGVPPSPVSGWLAGPAADECRFYGRALSGRERFALRLHPNKDWHECLHERHPLGQHVCRCAGCGPSCPGWARKEDEANSPPTSGITWACGLTTVPSRRTVLLPATLASLKAAGFSPPRLFVDGCGHVEAATYESQFGLAVTARDVPLRVYSHWFLSLTELYLRSPHADRYALFQDDLLACRGLRAYLDRCTLPEKGYWNLYTFPENQRLAPRTASGGTAEGWYPSNQRGKGAVALVFSSEGVRRLLASRRMVDRPHDPAPPDEPERPFKAVDGAVVSAFRVEGWQEWVHSPSLVQHAGEASTAGNGRHPLAESWPGEGFDALTLLGGRRS